MNFHVLTLFPEMIEQGVNTSITGRAINNGLLSINAVNIRDYAFNKHNSVDDYPYGGGAGMLMQAEPVYLAWESVVEKLGRKPKVLYMSPQGRVFDQTMAQELAEEEDLLFLCGQFLMIHHFCGKHIEFLLCIVSQFHAEFVFTVVFVHCCLQQRLHILHAGQVDHIFIYFHCIGSVGSLTNTALQFPFHGCQQIVLIVQCSPQHFFTDQL